ncbi:hypothetical protein LTR04_006156 [Oleoguttula sp. CCFEE 6159]|nr:hypothetical protein LTR04_006156 [Oleoguttula sp. CCFEE 6159]
MPARTVAEHDAAMGIDTFEDGTSLSAVSLPSPEDAERSPTARNPDSAKPSRRKKAPSTTKPTNLACLSCRPRKIKDYIADLENQIVELKSALAASRAQQQSQGSEPATSPSLTADNETIDTQLAPLSRTTTAEPELGTSDTLITRLCGMRGRLNSNDVGQLRYFGPTSSLHLTESVSSSIFGFCNNIARNDKDVEKDVPFEMQQYLLNLYWTFQHTALPLIHKEAFLTGMRAGQSPYFSRCLLSCILACAARISDNPQVRALAIPADDDDEGDRPVLMKQAEEALEKDLKNPSLTTVQLWALYLGRPPSIKLNDVSIRRPDRSAPSWDLKIFAAWVDLLDLAGQISDKFMQYSAIMVLVHRHNAGFGDMVKRHTPQAVKSRKECVEHASRMARLLDDYKAHHGNAYTLIGSALYNITMAATTLVADISEKSNEDSSNESAYLATCLRTMKEMENSEIVARSVRKIVQTIMRMCNVGKTSGYTRRGSASHTEEFRPVRWEMEQTHPQVATMEQDSNLGNTMAALNFEAFDMDSFFPFPFEQALPNLQPAGSFAALDEFYQGSIT